MSYPGIHLEIPPYLTPGLPPSGTVFATPQQRMQLVIRLSQINIEHGGGPFAAGVFDLERQTLLAPGVNLVVPAVCSVAHAEMVAIMVAEQIVGCYDLSDAGAYELVSSAEPCAQCFGAIPWSGVKRVTYAATRQDVEAIGFQEGPKPRDWVRR